MANKSPGAECYTFASESSCKEYETLVLITGQITCGCPGWTRRVDASGGRTCKHVRAIQSGRGEQQAIAHVRYSGVQKPQPRSQPQPKLANAGRRAFDLSGED